jgi:flavin-dependent dehydrogenase
MDGNHVTGIRGRSSDGTQITERAKIVIGADGLYSLVAHAVKAPVYSRKEQLTCCYFTYYNNLPVEEAILYVRDKRMIVVFPTNDEKTCIGIQYPKEELPTFRAHIEGNFLKSVELIPELAERVRSATQTERFLGVADIPNFFRKPYGPGWALVGDAGYHKDPFTAQGISDAFLSAKLLAEAIDAGFSERQPLEDALAEYEQRRNEEVLPRYEFNYQLATLEPPSLEMQQLFAALRNNQVEANNFFGTISGTVAIPEFFAPANLQRIISQNRMLV